MVDIRYMVDIWWIIHHYPYRSTIKPGIGGTMGPAEDWNSNWPARGSAVWSRRRDASWHCHEGRSKVNQILIESSGSNYYVYICIYVYNMCVYIYICVFFISCMYICMDLFANVISLSTLCQAFLQIIESFHRHWLIGICSRCFWSRTV